MGWRVSIGGQDIIGGSSAIGGSGSFSGGDLGSALGKWLGGIGKVVEAPTEALRAVGKGVRSGDVAQVGRDLGQVGTKGASGMASILAQGGYQAADSNYGRETLNDSKVRGVTAGLSQDYYGASQGAKQGMATGNVDKEYLEDYVRAGAKGAAFGYAYGAVESGWNSYKAAESVGGSVFEGASLPSLKTVGSGALVGSAAIKAAKGDFKGAAEDLGKSGTLPQFPSAPSELTDIYNTIRGALPSDSSDPAEYSDWRNGDAEGTIFGTGTAKAAGFSIATGLLIVAGVYLMKKAV